MGRPKLWGPDELRESESNDVEDGDLKVGIVNGVARIAVRERGVWVPDAFPRQGQTWRCVMKDTQTVRGDVMAPDPDLVVSLPASSKVLIRGRIYFDMQGAFRWRHGGPADATVRMRRSWLSYTDVAEQGLRLDRDFSTADLVVSAGGGGVVTLDGAIMTVQAGAIGIGWAAGMGTQAVVRAGSYLEFRDVT